jgi:hypothetical protein
MKPLPFIVPEIDRVVRLLHGSTIRLSLISMESSGFGTDALQIIVRAVAQAADIIGVLPDGSVGVLALRGGGGDGHGFEDRFMPGFCTLLTAACEHRDTNSVTVSVRALHRWACELKDSRELLQSLYQTPVRTLSISPRPRGLRGFPPSTNAPIAARL